ncbi:hypothetical protein [Streptomyces sp. NBC_00344]|uniref:hypothetical protein n=1 Tax=Streptomyces sp. NBC_00344 TaxID=2975720 RepID=UPI002E20F2D8
MSVQFEDLFTQEISGVVDAVVTTNRSPDGSLTFHLVMGPADRPEECDRIEFALDPEHAASLFGATGGRQGPSLSTASPVPCRVGVELNCGSPARW